VDPDALIAELRALLGLPAREQRRRVAELVGHLRDLDEWLSRGGYPPRAWQTDPPGALPAVIVNPLAGTFHEGDMTAGEWAAHVDDALHLQHAPAGRPALVVLPGGQR
jgi:hypothetical protein